MNNSILNRINKFIKPSKIYIFFYGIFNNLYKNELNRLIEELDSILKLSENTNRYDEYLQQTITLLISTNQIDKCLYYLYQSVLYYRRIKANSNELKSLNRILEICNSNQNIANRISILIKCHQDIAFILEENFELDEAIEQLTIGKNIVKKNGLTDPPIELIDYHIACIYIVRSMFDIAAEYLYGIIFFKPQYSVLFKENHHIMLYILTLLAKNELISAIRKQLKLIIHQCILFNETDEYVLIINIISSIENKDETHFMYETHRLLKRFKTPVFRDLIFFIKKTRMMSNPDSKTNI